MCSLRSVYVAPGKGGGGEGKKENNRERERERELWPDGNSERKKEKGRAAAAVTRHNIISELQKAFGLFERKQGGLEQ